MKKYLTVDLYNKASGDAAHFESLMREEHARLVQLDQAKKALETEVGAVQFLGCVKCVQRERESNIRQKLSPLDFRPS